MWRSSDRRRWIATQRSTCSCVGIADGAPLTPVIVGRMSRGALSDLTFGARRGVARPFRLSPHYGASKRWCLDHLPAVRAVRERRELVFNRSYLVERLTERVLAVIPPRAQRTPGAAARRLIR